MIALKVLEKLGRKPDLKEGDLVISNDGLFFFELHEHSVELIKTHVDYDLEGKPYKVFADNDTFYSILSNDNKAKNEEVEDLKEKIKLLMAENEKLSKAAKATAETKSKK